MKCGMPTREGRHSGETLRDSLYSFIFPHTTCMVSFLFFLKLKNTLVSYLWNDLIKMRINDLLKTISSVAVSFCILRFVLYALYS